MMKIFFGIIWMSFGWVFMAGFGPHLWSINSDEPNLPELPEYRKLVTSGSTDALYSYWMEKRVSD